MSELAGCKYYSFAHAEDTIVFMKENECEELVGEIERCGTDKKIA